MMRRGMTRRERQVTDPAAIIEILDACKVVHVAMIDGDEPYLVAMNYGYTMVDEKLTLYLHGATAGRKLDVLNANPKVCIEMDCNILPFEGKVACQYGIAYSSLMGSGKATIVEDVEEKKKGLSILMKTQTGKDFTFDDRMVSIVSVIRLDIEEYTAKCRPLPASITGEEAGCRDK